jgi:hypothetical protein
MLVLLYAQMMLATIIVSVVYLILSSQLAQLTFKYVLAAAGEAAFHLPPCHLLSKPKLNLGKVLLSLLRVKCRHLGSGDTFYLLILREVNVL